MNHLRLGVVGMSSAESSLAATFFRLHRFEPSFIWTLVEEPPFDALLVDAACHADAFAHLRGPGTQIQRLAAADNEQPGDMPRPIRSDVLMQWLTSIEGGLLNGNRDDFPDTEVGSETASFPDQASLSPASAGAPGVSAAAVLPEAPIDNTLFKLNSWPAHELLAGDMSRIRVAAMLSRRELSLQQLVEATGVTTQACRVFIQALDQAGLISTQASASLQPDTADPNTLLAHAAKTRPETRGIGQALVRSMRKRFGL